MAHEKIGILVQARMKSRRLPGKALLPIAGCPLLWRLCERMRRSSLASVVVVATSIEPEDDGIAAACCSWGISVHRGPEKDLTARLLGAARAHELTAVVRVTGDNPLTDPQGIDALIEAYVFSGASGRRDLVVFHNAHRWGYPYGTAAELFSLAMIEHCGATLRSSDKREYFVQYACERPNQFPCTRICAPRELHRPNCFLTVDYPEDLKLQCEIAEHFGIAEKTKSAGASLGEILVFLDIHPQLTALNCHLHQPYRE